MTDLFVPPPKTGSQSTFILPDEPNSPGAEAEAALTTEPATEASTLAAGEAIAPLSPPISPIDEVFFYGYSADGPPTLYQVNLTEGSRTIVTEPVDLYPSALDGLFTTEAGGLAGPEEVSSDAPSQTFTIIDGTSGKNFLIGTAADNALFGLGSDDLLLTGRGNNLAFGGAGNDTLVGGTGNNGLFGGAGSDSLEGGAGDDLLVGGPGSDILYGGAGANTLVGGAGADVFRLNSPGAYSSLVGGTPAPAAQPDTLIDFNAAEGDVLDFSQIAAQSLFAGSDLLPFVSFVQVGSDTHVQITTPLGQVSTEAILLNVQADTLTPDSLTFTPPDGLPQLK
ncbi:type I secretion C-terminal target domain-containing protein [Nodosilinea nodulosa]|uniref:type I secretion C-terminal target domain-containing protein n=1 Tax=Nodosilinea nodulosa TaxID=416001 RepID=UPI00030CD253|nr:type I secretion C-terminal target domain-containing protein [Nodosilinea nodulosa]